MDGQGLKAICRPGIGGSEGREVAQADRAGNVTTVIKRSSTGTSLESVSLQWAQQRVPSG